MATGLLVLDMLTDFTTGRLANPAAGQITGAIAALVGAARAREDWLVVYGNDAHRPGDFELAVFGEHAMAGSPGAEVIGELAPQPGDIVVPKRYYSAFTETDLDATCRVHRIERLVVTGQHTDCCCRHSCYDAFARGIAGHRGGRGQRCHRRVRAVRGRPLPAGPRRRAALSAHLLRRADQQRCGSGVAAATPRSKRGASAGRARAV